MNVVAMKEEKYWSQPIRFEDPNAVVLCTTKTQLSRLWFVNNPKLLERILAFLAKYQQKYEVELYAFVLLGNHYHLLARFPKCNRSAFLRDFNARVAEAVRMYVPEFERGTLVERRASMQVVPLDSDIRDKFFYCALQPITSGLTRLISDYPGYNSVSDAIRGIKRRYKLVDWAAFRAERRKNPTVSVSSFTKYYELSYAKLPELKDLSDDEYRKVLFPELEKRRVSEVQERINKGQKTFLTKEDLRSVKPGSYPKSTKRGGRRPLVLTSCLETKRTFVRWYLSMLAWYRRASKEYLSGNTNAVFPPGSYKPPGPFTPISA